MCFFAIPAAAAAGAAGASAAAAGTATYVALAVSIAATVAAGAMAVQASKAAAKYQDQVAAVNVKLAENKATDALQTGSVQEAQKRQEIKQVLGQQTATFGAQNVVESGTALDILGDTAAVGETDIARIRYNAARQAWGFGMDAYNTKVQNNLNQFTAKQDQRGTILSTIGKVAGSLGSAYSGGAFGGG
jgi:hypothetical protein